MKKVFIVIGVKDGDIIGVYEDRQEAIINAGECSQYYDEHFKVVDFFIHEKKKKL